MKKNNILWLLSLSLTFAACQNETIEETVQPTPSTGFTLKCTVEETNQTRAQIQLDNPDKDKEYFMWNDGDQISVFDKANLASSMTFDISGSGHDNSPSASAYFTYTEQIEEGTEIAAIYPNVANATVAEGLIGLEIPNYGKTYVGNYESNNSRYAESWRDYMKARMFMYASSKVNDSSANLHFHHLFAIARITYINITESEQTLNTVGLISDENYFASQIALDLATGETAPVTTNNLAVVTFDKGGKKLQPGKSCDAYIIFFPGNDFEENGTIQVLNGKDDLSTALSVSDILKVNPGATGFEAGKRYWFSVLLTDEGLKWAKDGPKIENLPLIAAVEEAAGVTFSKTTEGYVDVFANYSIIQRITYLHFKDKSLSDLTGIQYFTNLQTLYCFDSQLTAIDVSKNTKLRTLHVGGNQLSTLNVSQNKLLEELHCDCNQLEELDLSENTMLNYVNCSRNRMSEIDITQNSVLKNFYCGHQTSASGEDQRMVVIATDEQKANNVVDLNDYANRNVMFGPLVPVGDSNTGADNFATGGKF